MNQNIVVKGQVRQGEILLTPVTALPDGLKVFSAPSLLLGHGESGNAHTLVCEDVDVRLEWLYAATTDISALQKDGAQAAGNTALYVRVSGGQARIDHSDRSTQGHPTAPVAAGDYMITVDREYDPFLDDVRSSRD